MLAQTEEFGHMGFMAEDSGAGVRYLDPDRRPEGCHYPKKVDKLKNIKESDETEDWIP